MKRLLAFSILLCSFAILNFFIQAPIAHSEETTLLEDTLSDMPGFIEIKKYHPSEYKELMKELNEQYKQKDIDAIRAAAQAKIVEIFSQDLLKTPSGGIVLYLDSSTKLFQIAGERDPSCCDKIIAGESKCVEEILTFREMKDYLGMMGIVITLANTAPSKTEIDTDKASEDFNNIITSNNIPKENTCTMFSYIFDSLSNLPPERSSNAVKYLIMSQ